MSKILEIDKERINVIGQAILCATTMAETEYGASIPEIIGAVKMVAEFLEHTHGMQVRVGHEPDFLTHKNLKHMDN